MFFVLKEIPFHLFRVMRPLIELVVDQEMPEQAENLMGKGGDCFEVAAPPFNWTKEITTGSAI